jgi:hypothetical protein
MNEIRVWSINGKDPDRAYLKYSEKSVFRCHSVHCNKSHINPLNAELNAICRLLELLGAHHILHVSRIRVNWAGIEPGPTTSFGNAFARR